MSRYINSADALNTLKQLAYETALNQFDFDTSVVFEDIAKNRLETWVDLIPTADVVEVVRCKDCKHRNKYECNHIMLGGTKCGVTDDWYCADGERKETEDGSLHRCG